METVRVDHRPQVVSAALTPSRSLALIRRVAGPIWLRIGFVAVLSVPGRRTGTPVQVTVFPVEVDGATYLLSQYGVTAWVRNLRAGGRGELRRKGRTETFTAIEVDGDERGRVIAAFHAKTPKPFSRDFDQRPSAADHPTFRMEPARQRAGEAREAIRP
jgi:deazaflavin-dependent oxidoreductase (nitroreductase family)